MGEQAVIHGFTVTQAEGLTDEQREKNRLWVEALRSGKYPQTTGYLHKGDGFCCLGVYEDLRGLGWAATTKESFVRLGVLRVKCADDDLEAFEYVSALTPEAKAEIGVPDQAGFSVRGRDDRRYCLAELNDDKGLAFAKIADLIAFWSGLENPAADTTKGEEDPKVEAARG